MKFNFFPIVIGITISCLTLLFSFERIRYLWFTSSNIENIFIDDSTYASYKINKPYSTLPAVYLVGGSVTTEATLLDSELELLYNNKYGEAIKFYNLGTSSQSMSETAAILKTTDAATGSIFLVQFSFKRLDSSINDMLSELHHRTIPFLDYSFLYKHAAWYEKIIAQISPQIIINAHPIQYFMSERKCTLFQLLTFDSLCYESRPVVRHRYDELGYVLRDDTLTDYLRNIEHKVYEDYLKNHDASELMINEIISIARSKGAKIIFVEYPVNPIELPINLKARAQPFYKQTIAKIMAQAQYVDLIGDPAFNKGDFFDSQHMIKSGKIKMSNYIIEITRKNVGESNEFVDRR